jgi:uncharacterized protein
MSQPYQGYPPGQGYPPYRSPVSPADERTWAMLAHLAPFAGGFVGLPLLGPLVVYLVYKDRSAFVRRQAANALNFQIVLLIVTAVGGVVAVVLGIATLGLGLLVIIPLAIMLWVAAVVLQVLGAVSAHAGRDYQYPLTPTIVS